MQEVVFSDQGFADHVGVEEVGGGVLEEGGEVEGFVGGPGQEGGRGGERWGAEEVDGGEVAVEGGED